jgi:hypothetical protein
MGTGMNIEPHMAPWPEGKYYRVDQVDARIAELEAELERERMRLAACGVVAVANTPESAARARDMHPDYRSAACDDVARMVDSEMAMRAERDAARADAERYRWLNNPNNGLAATYLLKYGLVQPQELDAAIDAARGAA